uniref:Zinc transporter ZIP4/12 EF-hand domain-containing protein n=1 Tax=Pelusios castaneus TaxID=367368 RepID=A0A8C8S2A3_9SAUR
RGPVSLGRLLGKSAGAVRISARRSMCWPEAGPVQSSPAIRPHPALSLSPQCIAVPDVFTLVGKTGTGDANLTAADLLPLCTGVLLYLSDPVGTCTAVKGGQWAGQVRAFLASFSNGNPAAGPTPEKVAELWLRTPKTPLCCSATVSGQVAADMAGQVLVMVGYHALLGDCFHALPPPHYFLGYIFRRYGNESQNLTLDGLTALMGQLAVGEEDQHTDHHHDEALCLRPSDLLEIYGLDPAAGISSSDFTNLSPALIQQQISGACSIPQQRYLYGSLATLVICLCALFGITLLLCTTCASAYPYVIQGFVSLAVGSLTGDLLAVLGGLYAFFLLEKFFSILGQEEQQVRGWGREVGPFG